MNGIILIDYGGALDTLKISEQIELVRFLDRKGWVTALHSGNPRAAPRSVRAEFSTIAEKGGLLEWLPETDWNVVAIVDDDARCASAAARTSAARCPEARVFTLLPEQLRGITTPERMVSELAQSISQGG